MKLLVHGWVSSLAHLGSACQYVRTRQHGRVLQHVRVGHHVRQPCRMSRIRDNGCSAAAVLYAGHAPPHQCGIVLVTVVELLSILVLALILVMLFVVVLLFVGVFLLLVLAMRGAWVFSEAVVGGGGNMSKWKV